MAWIIQDRDSLIGFVDHLVERMVPGSPVEAIYVPLPDFFDLNAFDQNFDYYTSNPTLLYPLINYRNPNTPFSLTVMERTAQDAVEAVQKSGMKRVDHMMWMYQCLSADQTHIDVAKFAGLSGLPLVASQGRDFVVDYYPLGARAALRFLSAETYYANYDSGVTVDDRVLALHADTELGTVLTDVRTAMKDRGAFDTPVSRVATGRTVSQVIEHPQFEGILSAARVGYNVTVEQSPEGAVIHG